MIGKGNLACHQTDKQLPEYFVVFFIFMQTLNSQSEWRDSCSGEHYKQDFEKRSGSCTQQMI